MHEKVIKSLDELTDYIESCNKERQDEYKKFEEGIQILAEQVKETEEDLDMLFTGIANWIRQNCGSELYNKFYNFLKEKMNKCKIINYEIRKF